VSFKLKKRELKNILAESSALFSNFRVNYNVKKNQFGAVDLSHNQN